MKPPTTAAEMRLEQVCCQRQITRTQLSVNKELVTHSIVVISSCLLTFRVLKDSIIAVKAAVLAALMTYIPTPNDNCKVSMPLLDHIFDCKIDLDAKENEEK